MDGLRFLPEFLSSRIEVASVESKKYSWLYEAVDLIILLGRCIYDRRQDLLKKRERGKGQITVAVEQPEEIRKQVFR
jgi:hypothetical protein